MTREEAIKTLRELWRETNDPWYEEVYNMAIKALSAEARPTGEWVNRSMNIRYPEWERYTCSVCGKHSYLYDFCPNCGARMTPYKGGEEE